MRVACPLCEGPSSFVFETRDHNLENNPENTPKAADERFNYRRCELCHAIFLADPPDDLARYRVDGRPAPADGQLLDLIRPHAESGRLVEVGPGSAFADAAREAGYEVSMVEGDSPADALDQLPPSRVIAMWNVLEELEDPWACLEAAARNLEPGGVLALAMPNPGSFQFRMTRGRWPHVDAPRRRFLIPAGLLDERARSVGLELVALTARGRAGLFRNRDGWQRLLTRRSGRPPGMLARAFGASLAALTAPIERSDLRGSTYAAVFRKPNTSS
jgi:methyltransferase family protein